MCELHAYETAIIRALIISVLPETVQETLSQHPHPSPTSTALD
jgi:hypothetical protein